MPCPRCDKGKYTPGRSLTMHLLMHCPVAMLWDCLSALESVRKRTHGQMVDDSPTDTFANMAKRFNAAPQQFAAATRNPLMSMPSLAALSSTREERNGPFPGVELQEALFDDDNVPNEELPTTIVPITAETTVESSVELCPFKPNTIRLPPDIAFQVHLAAVLQRHRGNDLNMQRDITDCVSTHAKHFNVDFSTMHILSREQLVKQLSKTYQLQFLRPTIHVVTRGSGGSSPAK